eukprot:CAMPEP_0206224362 /NCGR_PEP_ID=MMETSP0047_2-20121206/6984_1 /ASSEMBLY_ACC=CAM_ASM_000192 /TAXON_ID=195065 /ORGANISM="Chroomonas mesostigmatica_cf, Strain CCMP1168" /LENGTH=32 /DNA_ID= /DNA_START= /DNA_END= /DNA_ORIENTATION=
MRMSKMALLAHALPQISKLAAHAKATVACMLT